MSVFAQQMYKAQRRHAVIPMQSDHANCRHIHTWAPKLARQPAWSNQIMQRMLHTRTIQAKLKVNEPDDKYEQEADRMAELVMRMPEQPLQAAPT